MRLALLCFDTRGGIQPFLALALGLRAAGHDVRFLAPEGYRTFIAPTGVDFVGLPGDPAALMQDPRHAGVTEKGFLAAHAFVLRMFRSLLLEWVEACLPVCRDCDAILGSVAGVLFGPSLAEKLGLPFIQMHVQPWTPTRQFPGMLAPTGVRRLPGAVNLLSHELTRQAFWQPLRPAVNALRRTRFGLPPAPFGGDLGNARRPGSLVLYGYSEQLLPRPADWPANAHVTGYWFLDAAPDWQPPQALVDFLAAGEPPVCVGFGSMSSKDAAATTRIVLDAVRLTGRRAILLSGWGGFDEADLPPGIFCAESVPHDWLFPRVAVSVHHGGAGTTGATLRAGVPAVIVPFTADQPFWAHCVTTRGLGRADVPRRRLTSDALGRQLNAVLADTAMREKSTAVGAAIRREDGVKRAVELIEDHLRTR